MRTADTHPRDTISVAASIPTRDMASPSGRASAFRIPHWLPVAPISCYARQPTSSIRGNWYGGYQAWVSQEVRQGWVVAEVWRREARPELGAEAWWVVVSLIVAWLVAWRREPEVLRQIGVESVRREPQELLAEQRRSEQQPFEPQPLVEARGRRRRARSAGRPDGRQAGAERRLRRHRSGEGPRRRAGRRQRRGWWVAIAGVERRAGSMRRPVSFSPPTSHLLPPTCGAHPSNLPAP